MPYSGLYFKSLASLPMLLNPINVNKRSVFMPSNYTLTDRTIVT